MASPDNPPASRTSGTGGYRYVVVVVLSLTYMLNFIDRQLLSVLAEPVKLELGLSDTQLGMLTGLTFALFYTVFGIPLAALADRWNRVRIIAIACGVWSLFTAASGMASNFLTLALARMGVGVGEAGCSPPSYSVLADYFPPERRGRALAIYMLGVPIGSLVGTMAGAWIAAHYGWRAAFLSVGLVGLLFAPLIVLLVREPRRGQSDEPVSIVSAAARPEGKASTWAAFRFFFRSPTIILNAVACGLTAFVSYGILNWAPAYLGRVQGMPLSQIASHYGLAIGGAMVIAAWLGAVVADRLGARNPMNYALMPALGLVISTPFLFGFTLADSWQVALACLFVPLVLTHIYLVPAIALLQNRTPQQYRATASALVLFLINLIGLGCGPLFVGFISDALEPRFGVDSLRYALQWLTPFIVLAVACQIATAWSLRRDQVRAAG